MSKYISVPALINAIKRRSEAVKWSITIKKKKIIWVGCFGINDSNLGDRAQTVAVQKFFREKYPDYMVIRFFREDVGKKLWNDTVKAVSKNDLVFIHSSGDFGSQCHIFSERSIKKSDIYNEDIAYPKYSWHDIRKKIILSFPNNNIIHLPTTVYYSDDDNGKKILEQDKLFYKDKNVIVLCRELDSLSIISKELGCKSHFFPDFVFYFKPGLLGKTKSGARLLLRLDSESNIDYGSKSLINEMVSKVFPVTICENIHKLPFFPVTDLIAENYLNSIFRAYQESRVIITDMMHGMIFAVINKIPCIALNEVIPHKLSGYKELLSKSVMFANRIEEIPILLERILSEPYEETDMSSYFESFREDINKVRGHS
jgi:pyruvyl transferase EpsI